MLVTKCLPKPSPHARIYFAFVKKKKKLFNTLRLIAQPYLLVRFGAEAAFAWIWSMMSYKKTKTKQSYK